MATSVQLPLLTSLRIDTGTQPIELRGRPFLGLPKLQALYGDSNQVKNAIDFGYLPVFVGQLGDFSFDVLEGLKPSIVGLGSYVKRLLGMTTSLPSIATLRIIPGASPLELVGHPFAGLPSLLTLYSATTGAPASDLLDLGSFQAFTSGNLNTFNIDMLAGLTKVTEVRFGSNVQVLKQDPSVALPSLATLTLVPSGNGLKLEGRPFAGLPALRTIRPDSSDATNASIDLTGLSAFVGQAGDFSFDVFESLKPQKIVLDSNIRRLTNMTVFLPTVRELRLASPASASLELIAWPFRGLPSLTTFGNLASQSGLFDGVPFSLFVGTAGAFSFDALQGLQSVTAIALGSSASELLPTTVSLPSVTRLTLASNPNGGFLLRERALDCFVSVDINSGGGATTTSSTRRNIALDQLDLATSVSASGVRYLNLSILLTSRVFASATFINLENNGAVIIPPSLTDQQLLKLQVLFVCSGNLNAGSLFETAGALFPFPNTTIFTTSTASDTPPDSQDEFRAQGCGAKRFSRDAFSPLSQTWRRRLTHIHLAGNELDDHRAWLNITLGPSLVQAIDLRGNELREIRPPGFEDATYLRSLHLDDNPSLMFLDSSAFSFEANRAVDAVSFYNTGLLTANCPPSWYGGVFNFGGGGRVAACFRCGPGSYCPGNNKQVPCPFGTYSNAREANSSSICRPCPAGTYQELEGQSRLGCVSCLPGFYSSVEGASSATVCSPCERGSYAAEGGRSTCTSCSPGRYHKDRAAVPADNARECEACARGKYSTVDAAVNSTFCMTCPSGFTTLQDGASSADDCSVDTRRGCTLGQGWDEISGSCRPCSSGFYGSTGLLGCQPCPRGTYWQAPALGTGRSAGGLETCTRCPVGRFSISLNATSSTVCQSCSFGFRPSDKGSGCVGCPQGTVPKANASAPFGFVCTACAMGQDAVVCAAGVTVPLPKSSSLASGLGSLASSLRSFSFSPARGGLLASSFSSGGYTSTTIPSQSVNLKLSQADTSAGDVAIPKPRFAISNADTAGSQNYVPAGLRDFVIAPYSLFVTIPLASILPVLLLLLPWARSLYDKARGIDAFSTARPLEDGDSVQKFSSPLGAGITFSYALGMAAGAAVLSLAWFSDNAAYSSALRPLPTSFPWSKIGQGAANKPLELSLGFAADATASCSSLQIVSSSLHTAPVANAYTLLSQAPSTTTTTTTTSDTMICAVQVAFPAVEPQASAGSAALIVGASPLANVSLILPVSSQAMAFAASGLLTTTSAIKAGTDATMVWVNQAVETPAVSTSFGIASVEITLSVTAVMEEDTILGKTTYGLLVLSASTAVTERTTDEIRPGEDSVAVTVMAVPTQQYLAITVTQRSTVTELFAGMAGLLSGIFFFYRVLFSFIYGLVRNAYGEPSWERRARLQHRERKKHVHTGPTHLLSKALFAAGRTELFGGGNGGGPGKGRVGTSLRNVPSTASIKVVTSPFLVLRRATVAGSWHTSDGEKVLSRDSTSSSSSSSDDSSKEERGSQKGPSTPSSSSVVKFVAEEIKPAAPSLSTVSSVALAANYDSTAAVAARRGFKPSFKMQAGPSRVGAPPLTSPEIATSPSGNNTTSIPSPTSDLRLNPLYSAGPTTVKRNSQVATSDGIRN
jgi:Tyrosine-protein kinase ephrin type A/B receptor-like